MKGILPITSSNNNAIREGGLLYLTVKPGRTMLPEHTDIGHERVILTIAGEEDVPKSTPWFRVR